ncbi:hypothetical protein LINPERPRIM_LOCUS1041 [Linum perenne]
MRAHSQNLSELGGRQSETLVSWNPPPDDWISINTDGSVTQTNNKVAVGGVIRNSQGRLIGAFSANLGS